MPTRHARRTHLTLRTVAAATLTATLTTTLVAVLHAAEPSSGEWTMRGSGHSDKVRFSLHISWPNGGQSSSTWDAALSEFSGLDLSATGRHDVRFAMVRDAGRFDCEGSLRDRKGAGHFEFTADPDYAAEMASLGFEIDRRDQFGMAIHDVSRRFARQMRDADLAGLDAEMLLAFRVHGVNLDFIEELRGAGQRVSESDDLVAFRVHGVSPEMVRTVRALGYSPGNDDLVAMRVHGASTDWIEELGLRGYDRVPLDELIAFRVHGVSPEFIAELQELGYSEPEPDELISMRIHGVTPSFIRDLQSRGLGDLTIDQLVGMRIHGID